MNQIKALIVSAALISGTPVLQAQDTTAKTISNIPDERVQVAFRKVDRKDLPGSVSAVDVASQMKLNYMTYSLENMDGWVNGFNGNSMWGMGSYLLVIDGVPREAGNVISGFNTAPLPTIVVCEGIISGRLVMYVFPASKYTVSLPLFNAACKAAASLVVPSPVAPKRSTRACAREKSGMKRRIMAFMF